MDFIIDMDACLRNVKDSKIKNYISEQMQKMSELDITQKEI